MHSFYSVYDAIHVRLMLNVNTAQQIESLKCILQLFVKSLSYFSVCHLCVKHPAIKPLIQFPKQKCTVFSSVIPTSIKITGKV